MRWHCGGGRGPRPTATRTPPNNPRRDRNGRAGATSPAADDCPDCPDASSSARVAVGLGSNVGDREANLAFGRDELAARGAVTWRAVSSVYETAPVGPVADQPPFLNQAGVGETNLAPRALLEVCLAVEWARGRERTLRWGPRTLDLDLLLFGDEVIDEPGLVVPHPEMSRRAFVLIPLAEIAGGWTIPGTGTTVEQLAATVPGREGVLSQPWRSSATKPPT